MAMLCIFWIEWSSITFLVSSHNIWQGDDGTIKPGLKLTLTYITRSSTLILKGAILTQKLLPEASIEENSKKDLAASNEIDLFISIFNLMEDLVRKTLWKTCGEKWVDWMPMDGWFLWDVQVTSKILKDKTYDRNREQLSHTNNFFIRYSWSNMSSPLSKP